MVAINWNLKYKQSSFGQSHEDSHFMTSDIMEIYLFTLQN